MKRYSEHDWQRLGHVITSRRVELGFQTAKSFAEHLGLTSRLVGDIENGRRGSYSRATISGVEQKLGWATGSISQILEGQPPTLRSVVESLFVEQVEKQSQMEIRGASSAALLDEIEDRLTELRRRYVVNLEAEDGKVKRTVYPLDTADDETQDAFEVEMEGNRDDYDLTADDGGGYDHQDEDEGLQTDP